MEAILPKPLLQAAIIDCPTPSTIFDGSVAWSRRIAISTGTYNWREFKHIFDTGNNDYVDFRFISKDVGTAWLDGISFREM